MAAPNIVNVTTITGKTAVQAVTTTATAIVSNAASSSQVIKVNALMVACVGSQTTVNVEIYRSSTAYRLAYALIVPAGATIDLLNKSLYLEEGDSLRVTAGANSALEATCSYEVIS